MNDLASAPHSDNRNGRQLVPVAEAVPALRDPYGRLASYGGGIAEELGTVWPQSLRILAHSVQAQMAHPRYRGQPLLSLAL